MVDRAENAFDRLFFKVEKVEVEKEVQEKEHVAITTSNKEGESLMTRLQFEEDRRLVFDEKDSLALKSLQEGVVDFSDKRIAIKGAALTDN